MSWQRFQDSIEICDGAMWLLLCPSQRKACSMRQCAACVDSRFLGQLSCWSRTVFWREAAHSGQQFFNGNGTSGNPVPANFRLADYTAK
jgi:hypothetical protein